MINPGLNVNLFEINTGNVFYKSVALQRIPYVSCRVTGSIVTGSSGQVAPTSSTPQSGQISLSISPPHPAGALMIPQATLIGNRGYIYIDLPSSGGVLTVYTYNVVGSLDTLQFYLTIF